jgi:RNA-binding protein 5/10
MNARSASLPSWDTRALKPPPGLTMIRSTEFEWPPLFEEEGASYVFDSRSSMFYEPRSDFFFDPRSKLYYGNRQQAYYRYNDTRQPPFEQVSGMGVGHGQSKKVGDRHQGSRKEAQVVPKMKVSIKLKTTRPLTSKSPQEKDDSARERDRPASSHTKRQYVAKMEKWNTLKSAGDQGDHKAMDSGKKSSTSSLEQSVIRKTSEGEPAVCKLCMRKFHNLGHLHRHEALSDLHKDNLKKASLIAKRQTGERNKEESPVHDEDRAKKRRLLNEGSKKVL